MRRLLRRQWRRLTLTALVLALGALWLNRLGLRVSPLDCDVLHEGDRCDRADLNKDLPLWIAGTLRPGRATTARLWAIHLRPRTPDAGFLSSPLKSTAREGNLTEGERWTLPGPPAGPLLVLAQQGAALGIALVRLAPQSQPEWLATARKDWLAQTPEAQARAAASLEHVLQQPSSLPMAHRAAARGLLGSIRRQQGHLDEAAQLLRSALAEDRQAGLVSNRAMDTYFLAGLLGQFLYQPRQAEELLAEHQDALEQMVAWRPFTYQNRALYRELQGDLAAALQFVEAGLRWADRLHDLKGQGALHALQTRIFATQGRFRDAQPVMQKEVQQNPKPSSTRAYALEALAGAQLGAWESSWPALNREADPRPTLKEAIALRETVCAAAPDLMADLVALARAELLDAEARQESTPAAAAAVAKAAQQARQLPTPDPLAAAEVEALHADLALLQRDLPGAETNTAALEARLEARTLEPLLAEPLAYRAALARARLLSDKAQRSPAGAAQDALLDEAEKSFAATESLLDRIALHLSLSLGRGAHLSRYSQGTLRYLAFLKARQRHSEAMTVLRVARTRALRVLSPLRIQDPQAQRELAQIRHDYEQARSALNALQKHGSASSEAIVLIGKMQAALDRLGQPTAQKVPAVAPGTLLLSCHEQQRGFYCLTKLQRQDGDESLGYGVQDLSDEEQLLGPIRAQLARAQLLKVLPRGALRAVPVHLLPMDGKALWERLPVVYGLDLEDAKPLEGLAMKPRSGRAVVYLDDEDVRAAWRKTLTVVLPRALGGVHLAASVLSGEVSHAQLLAEIERSDLLFLLGHLEAGAHHSLDWMPGPDLWTSDLLVLPRMPAYGIMLNCGSGQGSEVAGGTESLNLVNAALVRGAQWVIGATEDLNTESAAALSTALIQEDLARSPVLALQRVLRTALNSADQRTARALRVFVP